ncbi:MAG: carbon-phosphorus lyase complex subunit PhnI [Pseudomonadota bacterium]
MYVAVKGGEAAIRAAHALLAARRRGSKDLPALTLAQIVAQMANAVDRVMAEGSLCDPELAALALKQTGGEMIEAIFLIRAYRTTLPRFGTSRPIDTGEMRIDRRISATFKDLPGGQRLGPTFDYTHRLLDFALAADDQGSAPATEPIPEPLRAEPPKESPPRVSDLLKGEGLIEPDGPADPDEEPGDITRQPIDYPLTRSERLQALARGDEGFLLALGYSTQRGFGRNHPFAGEIRIGAVAVEMDVPELGFAVTLGEITVTECQMITQFTGGGRVHGDGSDEKPPQFTRGYGLVFGRQERKAMAMSLLDRALRCHEFGEAPVAPAQDEEFVIAHSDNIKASGFVEHLKLPHYVDFQAELDLVRRQRDEWNARREEALVDRPGGTIAEPAQ